MSRKLDEFFRVGIVTKPHGVHGEFNVYPTTDDPERFLDLETILVDNGKSRTSYEIEKVKFFKSMVILKLKGVDDRNVIEGWRDYELFVTREQAVELEEGEYFIADLIGMQAVDETGAPIGVVTDVLQTAANDIYVIDPPQGAEILVPVIKECVLKVDIEEGVMTLHLLPGLRELNE